MTKYLPAEYRELLVGPARRYFLATLIGALGTGLVISLNVIYIHDVRHHSIGFATLLMTAGALIVLTLSPMVGSLVDRIGPRWIILAAVAFAVAGQTWYAIASTTWEIMGAMVLQSASGSAIWGPSSVLLTRIIPAEQRQAAFGFNFGMVNFGIGIGGFVSMSVVSLSHPMTFTYLYLGTAVMWAAMGVAYFSLRHHGGPLVEVPTKVEGERGGWHQVIRDRRMVHLVLSSLVLLISGYGSVEAGFAIYVVNVDHVSVKAVGLIFAFNTFTIVFVQHLALRFIEGRSRTRVMGAVGALWALSWTMVGVSAHVAVWGALALLCISTAIFAVGETLWSPVSPALVNDIAPEHLRGRYNAASGLTWGTAGMLAPAITGIILESHFEKWWPVLVAGGSLVGATAVMTLRHSLTATEDGRDAPSEAFASN